MRSNRVVPIQPTRDNHESSNKVSVKTRIDRVRRTPSSPGGFWNSRFQRLLPCILEGIAILSVGGFLIYWSSRYGREAAEEEQAEDVTTLWTCAMHPTLNRIILSLSIKSTMTQPLGHFVKAV